MLTWLKQTQTLQRIVLGYWIIIPVIFYSLIGLFSLQEQVAIQHLVQSSPMIAVGNLVACLSLLQAGICYFILKFSNSKIGVLGHYMLITLIQQLLTLNILGVVLTLLYYRVLPSIKETIHPKLRAGVYVVGGVTLLLSMIVALVLFNLKHIG